MKLTNILMAMTLTTAIPAANAEKPIYLDQNAPIEKRVEDALSRMTRL